ncbi:GNAT family N-acetyltransferase [Paenibacillus protaetiae]|uniref:N-acetyltransferase n=1 Tax=Paenibacillus protaetiae TaxID=2509456 RepID=A0A4V0YEX1_9BACL|nr:GNAT family protein [Paenibacillus protaetiae]QAY65691.1 N-acetyltransferase [Paenibacillus protaetiae]
MEPSTIIKTERLILKMIDESYAGRVLDFLQRNSSNLQQWEPLRADEYYTVEFQQDLIRTSMSKIQSGELFRVWLFRKEDEAEQTIIGCITLEQIERGCFLSCRLGYKLDVEERNKGYMTEALQVVIRYAFDGMDLHRIEATIMPANMPSLRVVQKLGFHHEGVSRNYLKINGQWEDHTRWALLNERMER